MTGNQTSSLIESNKVDFDNWMTWRSIRVKIPTSSEAQWQARHTCDEIGLVVNKDYIARYGEVRFATKDALAFFMMNWKY
jgi:hypothetical protein